MQVYNDIKNLPDEVRAHVVAIGNFDGIHKGHQEILKRAKSAADSLNTKLVVLTFEPHPRSLFRPHDPPFRLTPAPLKHKLLDRLGVNYVISLPFDWDFASQTAETFIQDILCNALAAARIFVGEDFCFGQLRKGSAQTIRDAGMDVNTISAIKDEQSGVRYSSSLIRQALRAGDITSANAMLGWDWEIQGEVIRGDQRGRELGYPTANVALEDTLHPAYGIYACRVQVMGEDIWWPAATNIGIRPMFEVDEGLVEAHILQGFDRDIYGHRLRIIPVARIRGEAKFENLEKLVQQIEQDCLRVQDILA